MDTYYTASMEIATLLGLGASGGFLLWASGFFVLFGVLYYNGTPISRKAGCQVVVDMVERKIENNAVNGNYCGIL